MKVMPFTEPDVMDTLRSAEPNELELQGGPQPPERTRLLDGISTRDKLGESLVSEQEAREQRMKQTTTAVM